MDHFAGLPIKSDIYSGVHIDLSVLDQPNGTTAESDQVNGSADSKLTVESFDDTLKKFLAHCIAEGKRCVWFQVPASQSHFIPILTQNDFQFHHAKSSFVMLLKWIKADEEVKAPNYAHSMLGVGGLVYNPLTKKVLLIQEKTSHVRIWKFPGGYAEPGEDISETAIREVREETGLECCFHSLLTFRHRHRGAFGCSDFYFVALLTPTDPSKCELKMCDVEIADAGWFELDDARSKLTGFNHYVFERFVGQFADLPIQRDTNTAPATTSVIPTAAGHTIASEVIHSSYGHIKLTERVYSLGPINPF